MVNHETQSKLSLYIVYTYVRKITVRRKHTYVDMYIHNSRYEIRSGDQMKVQKCYPLSQFIKLQT